MSRLQESRGDMSGWIHTLSKLKNLLPSELGIVDELARAYAKTKRLSDSASLYREFLRQKPDSVNARYNYAYYLSRGGKYNESVKEYELLQKRYRKPRGGPFKSCRYIPKGFINMIEPETPRQCIKAESQLYRSSSGNLNEQLGDLLGAKPVYWVIDLGDKNGAALARVLTWN